MLVRIVDWIIQKWNFTACQLVICLLSINREAASNTTNWVLEQTWCCKLGHVLRDISILAWISIEKTLFRCWALGRPIISLLVLFHKHQWLLHCLFEVVSLISIWCWYLCKNCPLCLLTEQLPCLLLSYSSSYMWWYASFYSGCWCPDLIIINQRCNILSIIVFLNDPPAHQTAWWA